MSNFNMNATGSSSYKGKRVTVDNKLFKNIQIKDIEKYITDDCTVVIDCDTIPFRAAALQDKDTVLVKNIKTEEEYTFKTKTEFKGAARTEGRISQNSWLAGENLRLEAGGKEPYTLDDFTITPSKELKWDESKCMDNVKSFIDDYIEDIKFQTGCSEVLCIMGEGDSHRNKLLLPEGYKANRDSKRPLLLKKARKLVEDNYPTEIVVGIEADDKAEIYAFEGYKHYIKSGKFNYLLAALDKDARGTPSLLFDYNKDGPKWKNPNPWLIEATNKGVGEIEYVDGECKATGLLQVCFQCATSDSSDNYAAYLRFPKNMHPKPGYSDAGFYKDFVTLKTPKECLQKLVDKYYDFFPKGLKYTAWEGTEVDKDTLWWLEQIFTCVYMLRSENDNTNIVQLLDRFEVDYSKLVGNNVEKPKELVDSDKVIELLAEVNDRLNKASNALYSKSMKKGELVECLDSNKSVLGEIIDKFKGFYK